MRDSKDAEGPRIVFTMSEWEAFIGGVKAGEFDFGADEPFAFLDRAE